ncbi:hypothetical protein Rsub_03010 [Raphidocelis subcapitata]|uniref:WW domain-containing oxidoreductase n=1 Tax=Raphidocelis subcapitata TaxID=307507 RepID=A0A2V0NTR8_9CHLO|nr:hypothetical protein Rsub_03010 [Raphidocelis subcapitata]|eukprot:GBF90709.1 hypothetical protein Rsub_03010 [Raphidocelis subcapitata]
MELPGALHVGTAVAVGAFESLGNLWENAVGLVGGTRPRRAVESLEGHVAIVTGGNRGIGFSTARKLAERGATVVLACRDKQQGAAAAEALSRVEPLPGCARPRVECRHLDLGSLSSVRAFARDWNRSGRPVHLLICNAGIMSPPTKVVTGDGHEAQLQVNFLSHFVLSHELLAAQRQRRAGARRGARAGRRHERRPRWQGQQQPQQQPQPQEPGARGPAAPDGTRVVFLSSLTHHAGPAQWHDRLSQSSYSPFTSYALSKLCNTMAAFELQRRIDRNAPAHGAADLAVAVHPGIVHTDLATGFFRQTGAAALPWAAAAARGALERAFPLVLRSPDASAEDLVAVATAPAGQIAGRYFANGRAARAAPFARDAARCADLWDWAVGLAGLDVHESLS